MPIGPGSRLGPYEVTALIGEGGMGKVWRAHHSGLKRDDALKVLPDAFAADPDRLARFQREAQVLASLNHPNIAHVYGLEQSNSVQALVMELVEGPTLADRIAQGPISVDEALAIARQIAEALEAAHEQGIIHRDLKPANIKVRPDGTVKVLDFGLAKALEPTGAMSASVSQSPTITSPAMMTGVGVLLGTAAYMSPEQARGKAVDKRTDVWAFGCVLYEMLTGQRAFAGEDVTETLAAVVKTEPAWETLPDGVSPSVRVFLRRCLQKNQNQRLHDIADMRLALEGAFDITVAPSAVGAFSRAPWRRALPWATAIALSAATGIGGWYSRPTPLPSVPARLVIALPTGDLFPRFPNVAVSPDGASVVYVAARNGVEQLFSRQLSRPDPRPVSGTDGAFNPFFSPDGRWVGFFAQGRMKKALLGGGAPVVLCDAGISGGASWGSNGTIVFSPSSLSGLMQVSADGGKPEILTSLDPSTGEYSHRYPQVFANGNAVIFSSVSGTAWDESNVELVRLDTHERRVLIRGGHTGRVDPSGHLLYYRAGALLAVPFDLTSLRIQENATPVTVAEGVLQGGSSTVGAAYSASNDGRTIAYIPVATGARQMEQRLVWVDRGGKIEPLPAPTRPYNPDSLALSPDGEQIAVEVEGGTQELWIYDTARGSMTRLTSEEGSQRDPVWSPDGSRIAYRSNLGGGGYRLYSRFADGSSSEELLEDERNFSSERLRSSSPVPRSWSPDGMVLLFTGIDPITSSDIWALPFDGDRKPRPFLRTPATEGLTRFSPDGHWVAYSSNESGGDQVYVQPFPGPGRKWQITTDGGSFPLWNPAGGELFYRNGDQTMVVDVTTSPTFSAGRPRVLYEGPRGVPSQDGKRFLAVQPAQPGSAPTQIHVMLHWGPMLR